MSKNGKNKDNSLTDDTLFFSNKIDEKFKTLVYEGNYHITEIQTVHEYISFVNAINKFWLKPLYRGQANIEWKVDSGAYRLLSRQNTREVEPNEIWVHQKVLLSSSIHVNENQIKRNSLEHLAYLQHHGAKTNLIDFTENPLVALWFACSSEPKVDAMVSWIAEDIKLVENDFDIENMKVNYNKIFSGDDLDIYKYKAPYLDRRIIAQDSCFLISILGYINSHDYNRITIKAENKKNIISQLEVLGISERTIFPDYEGFIKYFDYNSKERVVNLYEQATTLNKINITKQVKILGDALESAKEVFNKNNSSSCEYDPIIAQLKRKLAIASKKVSDRSEVKTMRKEVFDLLKKSVGENHIFLARAYNSLGIQNSKEDKYKEAVENFKKAISICKNNKKYGDKICAAVYGNWANILKKQGEFRLAMRCLDLSLDYKKMYLPIERKSSLYEVTYRKMINIYLEWLEFCNKKEDIVEKISSAESILNEKLLDGNKKESDNIDLAYKYEVRAKVLYSKVKYNENIDNETKNARYNQALAYLDEAKIIIHKVSGKRSDDMSDLYYIYAEVCKLKKDWQKALNFIENAVAIHDELHTKVENTDEANRKNYNYYKLQKLKADILFEMQEFETARNIYSQIYNYYNDAARI